MKYIYIRNCARSEAEQRYIHASLEIWGALSEKKRQELRGLMEEIAADSREGRALFNMLVRGISPQAEFARSGVQIERLYRMRREFYDRFLIA